MLGLDTRTPRSISCPSLKVCGPRSGREWQLNGGVNVTWLRGPLSPGLRATLPYPPRGQQLLLGLQAVLLLNYQGTDRNLQALPGTLLLSHPTVPLCACDHSCATLQNLASGKHVLVTGWLQTGQKAIFYARRSGEGEEEGVMGLMNFPSPRST